MNPNIGTRSFSACVGVVALWVSNGLAGETRRVESPDPAAPIRLAKGLLDGADDATWGLPEIPHVEVKTIYRANEKIGTFVNHPQLAFFKGQMYCAFQLCPANEDASDSVAVYNRSADLNKWTAPEVIGPPTTDHTFRASVGWLQDGDQLHALILRRDNSPPGEVTVTEYRTSSDGENWSDLRVLLPDIMGSESARAITPGGRILFLGHGHQIENGTAAHKACSYYHDGTDFSEGWKESVYPQELVMYASGEKPISRIIEASWFRRLNGELVLVSRDLLRSGYIFAAVSKDRGATWGESLLTNIPDSSNMQCAGNLPDGTCYMLTTPGLVSKVDSRLQPRTPLILWLSNDGVLFDRAFLIRSVPPPRRFDGKSKTVGYSYVGSLVHNGFLYVSYATNKEDIEMSCIPLAALKEKQATGKSR